MKFLFPKQPNFFTYFKELNGSVTEITALFSQLSKNYGDLEQYWKKAEGIEHQADQVTHKIIDELNKTFITPFDREDIYKLAHQMDEIVDQVANAFHNIYLYELTEKDEAIDEFSQLMHQISESLGHLVEECFKNKTNAKNINSWLDRINELEDKGDVVFENAIRRIFSTEKDPIKVIKLKDILRNLERIMNVFKKAGHSIVGVMVKSC
jgi:predicted phosphate transport protein (TIGR00153 family)